jgi:arginine-tRNA-protein transferase
MKFGLTQAFACSYLDNRDEQLLVYVEEHGDPQQIYSTLIDAGFRRSGAQIYRPHCPSCQECQSLRIPTRQFRPSSSQKRLIKRNKELTTALVTSPKDYYYPLYERYINERHKDGTMYPPTQSQFDSFVDCQWKAPLFIEAYDKQRLIAVAVTDDVRDDQGSHSGLSAMYTFFDPDYAQRSIGIWMILQQIQYAQQLNIDYLYLGYQIDECQKMNYKRQFLPHERFYDHKWVKIDKN